MTTDNTFAGLPLVGTPNRFTGVQKQQRSVEELKILLTEIWDDPAMDVIECIVWEQYTPGFNDGDACIFHANDPYLISKTFDGELDDIDDIDGQGIQPWHLSDYMLERYPENAKYLPLSNAMSKVSMLCSGEFDTALNNVFGDPARVYVHRDKIVLDEYFETPY